MGAYNNVNLAFGEVGEDGFHFLGGACAGEVLHPDGEVFEASGKGVVVLIGQDGGGDKDGHLLAVCGGLEGGANGYFRLSETHVATDEAVHGSVALHVGLHGLGGCELVGGVFVDERSLELVLEI